ncbi:MAG: transglutaminase, partial [Halobacteriota archaeon]
MSTIDGTDVGSRLSATVAGGGYRWSALLGVLLLTLSYTSVLYHVTDVVGGSEAFALVVAAVLLLATLFGRSLAVRDAALLSGALVVVGFTIYFLSIPKSQLVLLSVGRVVSDVLALFTGLSVLRLTSAGIWSLAFVPAPLFFSWYLALRGRYVGGVVVGGVALSLFVMTGDADTVTTLVGVTGTVVAVGFGTLDRFGGTTAQVDVLALVIALMIVLSATFSVVPGSGSQP